MVGDQITDIEFARMAKVRGFMFKGNNLFKFIKKRVQIKLTFLTDVIQNISNNSYIYKYLK